MTQGEQDSREEPQQSNEHDRFMSRSAIVLASAGAVALGAGCGIAGYAIGASRAPELHKPIDATVQCSDSLPVTGIWVVTAGGRAGWANRRSLNSTGDTVAMSFDGDSTNWRVDVGCGGTPQHWAHNLHSTFIDQRLVNPTIGCSTDINPRQGPQCVVLPAE